MLDNDALTNKKKRGRGESAGIGHNATDDDIAKKFVERYARNRIDAAALNDDGKEILREAKDAGCLKTSIKATVKWMLMSEDQRQSKKEVDSMTEHYTTLCADLPLFRAAA